MLRWNRIFNLVNVLLLFIYAIIGFQIKHIKPEEVIKEAPEKANFRGVGGHRVGPTEHEVAVAGG